MGLYNNVPTFTYISATGITVSYNNKVYTVQSFYTNKKYIYWDSDNGTVLQASNTMPTRSEKVHLVLINDNGIVTTVPSTNENFEISYDGDSDDAIKSRIYALYEKDKELGDKYMAIEQDVTGIKQTVGTSDGKDGTIIDRVSKVEQYADKINLSVGENKKEYDSDKEFNELRDNLNAAIIKLNSDLGIANSDLQDYYKDDKLSNEEKTSIQAIISQIESSKADVLAYVDVIKEKVESGNFTALDSAVSQLNTAHTFLVTNINTAIGDSIVTTSEKTVIINAFANYNLKVNEFKNTCDDIIFLGVGGVITEKLALISMKSNEIKLSVSSAESTFSSKLEDQNDALNKEIADAKKELSDEISDVLDSLGGLENNMNEAFRDGVLSDAEKVSIGQQLQRLQKEKEDVDKQYEALYNNTFLVDATTYKPKSELKTAYTRFTSRYDSLILAINTVINKTTNITDSDRSNIENSMTGYREASSNYMTKATNAMDSIADKRAESQSSKIDKKYSEIILSEDGIINQVGEIQGRLDNNDGEIEDLYEKNSKVEQRVDNLKISFTESGGYNLLMNGCAKLDTSHWSSNGGGISRLTGATGGAVDTYFSTTMPNGITANSVKLKNDTHYVYQAMIYCVNTTLSGSSTTPLHFWCSSTDNTSGNSQLNVVDYSQNISSPNKWTKCYVHFKTAKSGNVYFKPFIYTGGASMTLYVTEIMLSESQVPLPYSPHPNEVYSGITKIDKDGIRVSQSNYNGHTRMNASGFYVNNGSEDVISITSSGSTFKGTLSVGSSVPASTLNGTISNDRLNTSITGGISTLNDNKDNWSNAFNRVKEWAYGAVTGKTTINGGLIETNTILAEHIAAGEITANHISSKTLTGVTIKNDAGTFIVNPSGSITIGTNSSYKTVISNAGIRFNDSNGENYSTIDGGRIYFNDDGGSTVGFVGRTTYIANNAYLTALNAKYGHSVALAHQTGANENYMANFIVSSQDMALGDRYYKQGINMQIPRIATAYFIPIGYNWTGGYYPKVTANNTNYGYGLGLYGVGNVQIGTVTSSHTGSAIDIIDDSTQVNKTRMDFWSHVDLHKHTISNGYFKNPLDAQSSTTYNLMKSGSLEMDTFSPFSFTENELRYVHRESVYTTKEYDYDENGDYVPTGRYICYCELPIFMAENIELNYHVNIGKLSFGDYRIIEKDPYYFIVESEKDNFSFTYEVVGKNIDKASNNIVVANYGITKEEDNDDDKVMDFKMD